MYLGRLRKLNHAQCVQFAIFCAELVLPVFEKEYPDDSRPRRAIDAAKEWLKTLHIVNPHAAYVAAEAADDAADAAHAAARAAARGAGHADYAADAAEAASTTASTHTDYTAYHAYHAEYAAHGAGHAGADKTKIENYLRELEKCTSID